MANEIVQKPDSFSTSLTNTLMESRDALPKDLNTTRFVTNAVALLNGNEMLAKFAKANGTGQIKAGLLRGAVLGLDALSKEFYLIPYANKLEFMVDYRGAVKLVKKYSLRPIKDIYARVVKQGDEFTTGIDRNGQYVDFKPIPFNDGAPVGVFAVCMFEDGGMLIDTMSKAEVENSRKQSKAANSPAWTKFWGEMAKKTVLHRLCKMIQIDFENPKQREEFDEDGAIEKTEYKGSIPNPFSEEVPEEVTGEAEVIENAVVGE